MELYIGKQHGEIGLEEADALMAKYPKYAERALHHCIKSESNRLRGLIKRTIQQGGPNNGSWPKLNPHTGILNKADNGLVKNYRRSKYKFTAKGTIKYKKTRNVYQGRMLSTKREPLSKLAGGTRYSYDKGMMVSEIGFLSSKSPGASTVLAKKHAMGFSVPVTKKSRRWAFGLGFPLKKETTRLDIPPRPVVGPVFEAEKGQIIRNINRNVLANIQSQADGKGLIYK